MEEALRRGTVALREAIGRSSLFESRPADAVKLVVESFTKAKVVDSDGAGARVPPAEAPDAALQGRLEEACGRLLDGDARGAVEGAQAAVAAARNAGDKASEVPALRLLLAALAAARDVDGALRAARELTKGARKAGDRRAQVFAAVLVVDALLASGEPGQAASAAEEAVTVARAADDKQVLAAALGAAVAVHQVLGKPVAALKAATEVLELAQGSKRSEAAASLLVADAYPGSREAVAAAKAAVAGYRELGDKLGEGAALVALAFAHGDQVEQQFEDARRAAMDAVTIFREQGDRAGEGLALSTASRACGLKEEAGQAASLAREAQQAFREAGLSLGEQYAADLAIDAPYTSMQQSGARLLLDDEQRAHIEINESATQDSLESIVTTLHHYNSTHQNKWLKAVILHVEGTPVPARLQSYAMATGTFLVGIRSLGVPMVSCCWGTISGPSWGLALAGDYRLTSADTRFMLPITRPVECLAQLVGQNTATYLTMESGTLSAATVLEMGVFHQVQSDQEQVQKGATEQAKRISNFPVLSARQTLMCMTPDSEKYIFVQ